jgi:hypothetical protein
MSECEYAAVLREKEGKNEEPNKTLGWVSGCISITSILGVLCYSALFFGLSLGAGWELSGLRTPQSLSPVVEDENGLIPQGGFVPASKCTFKY